MTSVVAPVLVEVVGVLESLASGVGSTPAWTGAAADAYDAAATRLRRRAAGLADALTAPDPARARALVEALAGDDALLLAHDPGAFGGEGRVVVAVGDVATADDVVVMVPGLGTDAGDVATLTDRARDLRDAADRDEPGEEHAVVAWVGYDAPAGLGVLTDRMARAGGERLAADVDALRAARADDPAHLTVVGHSYGATTTALAATGPGLAADDVVLAGSPGAGDADRAADLGVGRDHVWVLRHSLDPVAALGTSGPLGLGPDPALDTWGATRLRAESPRAGEDWPAAEHASYFRPGGEGLGNLAHVATGRVDGVTTAPPLRDPWWAPPLDPELGRTPARPAVPAVR